MTIAFFFKSFSIRERYPFCRALMMPEAGVFSFSFGR